MSARVPSIGSQDTREIGVGSLRALALCAAALVALSYLTVLYRVTDVVGTSGRFAFVIAGALLAGVLCGRVLRTPVALVLGAGIVALGTLWYVRSIPNGVRLLVDANQFSTDVVALLTGLSVLRVVNAGTWAIAFVPAPTFLLWYFAIRRRYVLAALCGGGALGLFVLTGDAGTPLTLLGVVGVAGLVGFGELDHGGGDLRGAESVASVLAAMIVVSLALSIVPGGAADPLFADGGGDGGTIEASLVNADEQVSVSGAVSLSPQVRFRVESEAPAYWRVGAYDRYTGSDWYRTGETRPYDGSLSDPPGDSRTLTQTYEASGQLGVLPAAWRPTELDGSVADTARVTATGSLRPGADLPAGTTYTVRSEVPDTTAAELQNAGTDYPDRIAERYTQLPESTPERVEGFTAQLTANANTSYETARVVERWLENNKRYSLDVERPDGDVADAFIFDMEAGYCVHYATTMTTMLRSQGIPARFVVGYMPGEQVGENEWVVRGLDSHAWVEVYFPDEGWIRFDPTPPGPRENAEAQSLENARAAGQANVDTNGTSGASASASSPSGANTNGTNVTSEPFSADSEANDVAGGDPGSDAGAVGDETATDSENASASNATGGLAPSGVGGVAQSSEAAASQNGSNASSDGEEESRGLPVPTRERLLLGLIVFGGVLAGAHRSGATGRAYRAVWLRRQRRRDPPTDVERAFARLEYLLAREHRERRPGETSRAYLAAIGADKRARRVGEFYEHARYAERTSDAEAAEAVSLVDELVAERSRFGLGRLGGGGRGRRSR